MNATNQKTDEITRRLLKCGTPLESSDLRQSILNQIKKEQRAGKYKARWSFPWVWIILPCIFLLICCIGFILAYTVKPIENPFLRIPFEELIPYIVLLSAMAISFVIFIQVDKIFTLQKN